MVGYKVREVTEPLHTGPEDLGFSSEIQGRQKVLAEGWSN